MSILSVTSWQNLQSHTLNDDAKSLSINELAIGKMLLIGLNLLVLMVDVLDINQMYIIGKLPAGISHTDFVHQGIGALIFSIILATSIIMFLFRDALHFIQNNKIYLYTATAWCVLNVILVFNTLIRNYQYIAGFGLTYKRIGVYVYLGLCLVGLTLLLFKLWKNKSLYFTVTANFFIWISILSFSSLLDWDQLIYNYNLTHPVKEQYLDRSYFGTLNPDLAARQIQEELNKGFHLSSNPGALFEEDLQLPDVKKCNYDYQSYHRQLYDQLKLISTHVFEDYRGSNLRRYNALNTLRSNNLLKQKLEYNYFEFKSR